MIQGPRFSTRAESRWYRARGLARRQHDAVPRGVPRARARHALRGHRARHRLRHRRRARPGVAPVTQEQVFAFFEENLHRVRALLHDLIPRCRPNRRAARARTRSARCTRSTAERRGRCGATEPERRVPPTRRSGRAMTGGPGDSHGATRAPGPGVTKIFNPRELPTFPSFPLPWDPEPRSLTSPPTSPRFPRRRGPRRSPRASQRPADASGREPDAPFTSRAARVGRRGRRHVATVRVVAGDLGALHRRAHSSAPTSPVVLAARDLPLGTTVARRRPPHRAAPVDDRRGRRAARSRRRGRPRGRGRGAARRRRRRAPSRRPAGDGRVDGVVPAGRRAVHVRRQGRLPAAGRLGRRRARHLRPVARGGRGSPGPGGRSSRTAPRSLALARRRRGRRPTTAGADTGGAGRHAARHRSRGRAVAYAASIGDVTLALAPPERVLPAPAS